MVEAEHYALFSDQLFCSGDRRPRHGAGGVIDTWSLLRTPTRGLGQLVRFVAVRLRRTGMHLRLFVLALFVVMACLAVVVGGRLVFGSGILVLTARRVLGRLGRCH